MATIVVAIAIFGAFILFMLCFRKAAYLGEEFFRSTVSSVISQFVGGCLIALISFWAANYQFEIQESKRVRNSELDSLIRLENEIKENFFGAGIALKSKPTKVGGALLKTEAWDKEKYNIGLETDNLWGSLKILYQEIDEYNFLVSTIKFNVAERGISPSLIPDTVPDKQRAVLRNLYTRLNKFRKLMAREIVLSGYGDKKIYENEFGKWSQKADVPYVSPDESPVQH